MIARSEIIRRLNAIENPADKALPELVEILRRREEAAGVTLPIPHNIDTWTALQRLIAAMPKKLFRN